jgi:hypothetical protein
MADQPGTITAAELCALTSLTDRRHRQLADEGYFPPPHRGRYKRDPTLQGLFRHFTEQLHKKDDNLAAEQKRLTKARRETAEEHLAILREQYVEKSEIGPALRNISMHQRAVLQRKLETELAPALTGLKTPEILKRMKTGVDEICAIFRDGTAAWCEEPGTQKPAKPPKSH